jgi:hypothetical protein
MESVYHIVTIRVNETSWAHVWRLRSRYLRTGYDSHSGWVLSVCGCCSDPYGCADVMGVHLARSSHPRIGSSLLLGPLLSGKRGACNGSNVHHRGENSNVKRKSPLHGMPNVKVVCDTSLGTTTRAVHRGSLIRGTKALDAQAGWTWWFMWFGPSERNTIRPWREWVYCCVCWSSLELNLPKRVCLFLSSVWPFIVKGQIVTL